MPSLPTLSVGYESTGPDGSVKQQKSMYLNTSGIARHFVHNTSTCQSEGIVDCQRVDSSFPNVGCCSVLPLSDRLSTRASNMPKKNKYKMGDQTSRKRMQRLESQSHKSPRVPPRKTPPDLPSRPLATFEAAKTGVSCCNGRNSYDRKSPRGARG